MLSMPLGRMCNHRGYTSRKDREMIRNFYSVLVDGLPIVEGVDFETAEDVRQVIEANGDLFGDDVVVEETWEGSM